MVGSSLYLYIYIHIHKLKMNTLYIYIYIHTNVLVFVAMNACVTLVCVYVRMRGLYCMVLVSGVV